MNDVMSFENELNNFLTKAKKETYANEKVKKIASLRPESSDYHFSEGEWIYHDTYFGGKKFIGEEVVYFGSGRPKWGMNYYGFTLDDSSTEAMVDMVLRPALMLVDDSEFLPLRGPKEFINNEWKYSFNIEGDLMNFIGIENIFCGDKLVYKLYCHGGFIE